MSLNPLQSIGVNGGLGAPSLELPLIGNIPTIPLISTRDFYLQAMESWITTIPMTSQWMVFIESFPKDLNQNLIQELEKTTGSKNGWNIKLPKMTLTNFLVQKTVGCILAQGFQCPKHTNTISHDIAARGFLGGPIMDKRGPNDNLILGFLETNMSFVDSIVRPWCFLTAHKGLVARPKAQSVKTNIHIFQYAKTNQNLSQVPRKIWSFYDVAPISVMDGTDLTYSEKNDPEIIKTEWAYNYYEISFSTYVPIPDLISKFANGGFKEIIGINRVGQSVKKVGNLF